MVQATRIGDELMLPHEESIWVLFNEGKIYGVCVDYQEAIFHIMSQLDFAYDNTDYYYERSDNFYGNDHIYAKRYVMNIDGTSFVDPLADLALAGE